METLRIDFVHMMLFHRAPDANDVLLPEHNHFAEVVYLDRNGNLLDTIPLTEREGQRPRIFLRRGETPVLAGKCSFEREHRVVNMGALFRECGFTLRRARRDLLRGHPVKAPLRARVELPGGQLHAGKAQAGTWPNGPHMRWQFEVRNGKTWWDQPMTNVVHFTSDEELTGEHTLVVFWSDAEHHLLPCGQGQRFVIANSDLPAGGPLESPYPMYDFELLYAMLDLQGQVPPVPTSPDSPFGDAATRSAGASRSAVMTPEFPMCPPGDDCEENGEPCGEG